MDTGDRINSFDREAARERCRRYRIRILEVSQQVMALHIAPAYSCMEMVDVAYNRLMRQGADGTSPDIFLMSKGHGCMVQYVILEERGVLARDDLDRYCTADGRLGSHPDYGVPGIAAATGSLGHGLAMAVGMALAERIQGGHGRIFVTLSDGELQEGSSWEAFLMASSFGITNLVAFIDYNDFQTLGRTSETHPSFYPLVDKLVAFGWETVEIDGHDSGAIFDAVRGREGKRPFAVIGKTVKGKGVSYMENVPIWHYRSPNREEYDQAMRELTAAS